MTHASPLTAHQALRHMPLPANATVVLVQSNHSFSRVGGSGFQSVVFFTCPDVRCFTHDQSKEKDLWLRPQHLLDMTSLVTRTQQQLLLQAFTLPPPLASGVIDWGTDISILGFPQSARRGSGTVPGQWQVVVPCCLVDKLPI